MSVLRIMTDVDTLRINLEDIVDELSDIASRASTLRARVAELVGMLPNLSDEQDEDDS